MEGELDLFGSVIRFNVAKARNLVSPEGMATLRTFPVVTVIRPSGSKDNVSQDHGVTGQVREGISPNWEHLGEVEISALSSPTGNKTLSRQRLSGSLSGSLTGTFKKKNGMIKAIIIQVYECVTAAGQSDFDRSAGPTPVDKMVGEIKINYGDIADYRHLRWVNISKKKGGDPTGQICLSVELCKGDTTKTSVAASAMDDAGQSGSDISRKVGHTAPELVTVDVSGRSGSENANSVCRPSDPNVQRNPLLALLQTEIQKLRKENQKKDLRIQELEEYISTLLEKIMQVNPKILEQVKQCI
eukprot:Clim_evm29s221 gene=Clim_evmTU29s221